VSYRTQRRSRLAETGPRSALASASPELTQDTDAWYAGTRARVEARATLEQAEELRKALAQLGERLGE
jgi:hypothetical protein